MILTYRKHVSIKVSSSGHVPIHVVQHKACVATRRHVAIRDEDGDGTVGHVTSGLFIIWLRSGCVSFVRLLQPRNQSEKLIRMARAIGSAVLSVCILLGFVNCGK